MTSISTMPPLKDRPEASNPGLVVHAPNIVETTNFEGACRLHGEEAPEEWRAPWCGGRTPELYDSYGGGGRRRFIVYPDGPDDFVEVEGVPGAVPVARRKFTVSVTAKGSLSNINDSANRYPGDSAYDKEGARTSLAILHAAGFIDSVSEHTWEGIEYAEAWADGGFNPEAASYWQPLFAEMTSWWDPEDFHGSKLRKVIRAIGDWRAIQMPVDECVAWWVNGVSVRDAKWLRNKYKLSGQTVGEWQTVEGAETPDVHLYAAMLRAGLTTQDLQLAIHFRSGLSSDDDREAAEIVRKVQLAKQLEEQLGWDVTTVPFDEWFTWVAADPSRRLKFVLKNNPSDHVLEQLSNLDVGQTPYAMLQAIRQAGEDPETFEWTASNITELRAELGLASLRTGAGPSELLQRLEELRPALTAVAQAEVDAWMSDPDEDGGDPEVGFGGICDRIAAALGGVLADAGIDFTEGGQPGDDHAYLIAYDDTSAFEVDVPPHLYESGGGYSWIKRPDAKVEVVFAELPRHWVEAALRGSLEEAREMAAHGYATIVTVDGGDPFYGLEGQAEELQRLYGDVVQFRTLEDYLAQARVAALYEDYNYWVEPDGTRHQVRTTTHERWALAERGTTVSGLLAVGWVRVAPPDAIQVEHLDARTRALVRREVAALLQAFPTRAGVWVETDEDNLFIERTPTGRVDFSPLDKQAYGAGGRTLSFDEPLRPDEDEPVDADHPMGGQSVTYPGNSDYDLPDTLMLGPPGPGYMPRHEGARHRAQLVIDRLSDFAEADQVYIRDLMADAAAAETEATATYERADQLAQILQRQDLDETTRAQVERGHAALLAKAEDADARVEELHGRVETTLSALSEEGEPQEGSAVPEDLLRPFAAVWADHLSRPRNPQARDLESAIGALRWLARDSGADPERLTDEALVEAAKDAYDRLFSIRRKYDPRFRTSGKNTLARLSAANPQDAPLLQQLAEMDPTNNHDWLEALYRWAKAGAQLADIHAVALDIDLFKNALRDAGKGVNPHQYPTLEAARAAIDELRVAGARPRLRKQDAEYQVLVDDDRMTLYKVENKEASCLLGSDSRWCSSKWDADWYEKRLTMYGPEQFIGRFKNGRGFMVRTRNGRILTAFDKNDDDLLRKAHEDADLMHMLTALQAAGFVNEQSRTTREVQSGAFERIVSILEHHGDWAHGGVPREVAQEWFDVPAFAAQPGLVDSWLDLGVYSADFAAELAAVEIHPRDILHLYGTRIQRPRSGLLNDTYSASDLIEAVNGVGVHGLWRDLGMKTDPVPMEVYEQPLDIADFQKTAALYGRFGHYLTGPVFRYPVLTTAMKAQTYVYDGPEWDALESFSVDPSARVARWAETADIDPYQPRGEEDARLLERMVEWEYEVEADPQLDAVLSELGAAGWRLLGEAVRVDAATLRAWLETDDEVPLAQWLEGQGREAARVEDTLPGRAFEVVRPFWPTLMGGLMLVPRDDRVLKLTGMHKADPALDADYGVPRPQASNETRVHLVEVRQDGSEGRTWFVTATEMTDDAFELAEVGMATPERTHVPGLRRAPALPLVVTEEAAEREGLPVESPGEAVPPGPLDLSWYERQERRAPWDRPKRQPPRPAPPSRWAPAPADSAGEALPPWEDVPEPGAQTGADSPLAEERRRRSAPLAYQGMLVYDGMDVRQRRARPLPAPRSNPSSDGDVGDRGALRGPQARADRHSVRALAGPGPRGLDAPDGCPRLGRDDVAFGRTRVTGFGNTLEELYEGRPPDEEGPDDEPARWAPVIAPPDGTLHLGQRAPWVAVDLDGTLLEAPDPASYAALARTEQPQLGEPLTGAAEALRELAALGWRISVYTARFGDEGLDAETIERWAAEIAQHLDDCGIPYSDIWVGRKPRADYFVDDKAVPFSGDWPGTLELLLLGEPVEDLRAHPEDEEPDASTHAAGTGPFDAVDPYGDPLGDRGSRGIRRGPLQ